MAEGVEHAEQLDFLAEHGCALAQGFHLARPLPAEQVFQPEPARR
jgi:EAL domain-containing protein (putative c-di-GMP-specific phosphodiesterase class I)